MCFSLLFIIRLFSLFCCPVAVIGLVAVLPAL